MWEYDENRHETSSNIDEIQNDLESDKSMGNNIPIRR